MTTVPGYSPRLIRELSSYYNNSLPALEHATGISKSTLRRALQGGVLHVQTQDAIIRAARKLPVEIRRKLGIEELDGKPGFASAAITLYNGPALAAEASEADATPVPALSHPAADVLSFDDGVADSVATSVAASDAPGEAVEVSDPAAAVTALRSISDILIEQAARVEELELELERVRARAAAAEARADRLQQIEHAYNEIKRLLALPL